MLRSPLRGLGIGLAALGLWVQASDAVSAQTVTLAVEADTHIRSSPANRTAGSSSTLEVQAAGNHRTLLRFDQVPIVAAVGSGSLAFAMLELYVGSSGGNWGATGDTVDIHRLTAAWTEEGATWNCPLDTNPANSRADCGALWNGGVFDEEPTGSLVHRNGEAGWVSFDVSSDVRAFLGGEANFGWLIKKTDEGQSGRVDYVSSEGAPLHTPRLRLVIESTSFDEVPPTLRLISPGAFVVNEPNPTVAVEFYDGGSGIDLASLVVEVDGLPTPTTCSGAPSCLASCLA